jgi:divalent metal cation (Fe/Co/Zn/Cd) transporter
MHCLVAEDVSIEAAHAITEEVEAEIRAALPAIHRVTIHTEPREGAD